MPIAIRVSTLRQRTLLGRNRRKKFRPKERLQMVRVRRSEWIRLPSCRGGPRHRWKKDRWKKEITNIPMKPTWWVLGCWRLGSWVLELKTLQCGRLTDIPAGGRATFEGESVAADGLIVLQKCNELYDGEDAEAVENFKKTPILLLTEDAPENGGKSLAVLAHVQKTMGKGFGMWVFLSDPSPTKRTKFDSPLLYCPVPAPASSTPSSSRSSISSSGLVDDIVRRPPPPRGKLRRSAPTPPPSPEAQAAHDLLRRGVGLGLQGNRVICLFACPKSGISLSCHAVHARTILPCSRGHGGRRVVLSD